jgi:hypothetical protein
MRIKKYISILLDILKLENKAKKRRREKKRNFLK